MKNGFTLVEMAIVLIIIGLLLAGLITPLSSQIEQRRIDETQKAMNEITQALYGFALANGRLPCPADPTIASGTASAGLENRPGGVCASANGVLPWAALGVNETDAWGWRYTYRVTPEFGRNPGQTTFTGPSCPPSINPTQAGFALCSAGDNIILNAAAGAILASNVPAVVVSHGRNGLGAYTTSGTQIGGAAGEEAENANGDVKFISHTPTAAFDDLVVWLSPNTLMNRMVSAGKLP